MAKCTEPRCDRQPLESEVAALLGVEGLCEDHAALVQRSEEPSRGGSGLPDFVLDRAEHEAWAEGNRSDEEILGGRLSTPKALDDGLADLRWLRELEEQAGRRLLGRLDSQIVDVALREGRVSCPEIAEELNVHRVTTWRHVQRLRAASQARPRPMNEAAWRLFGPWLAGTREPEDQERVSAFYRKQHAARKPLRPPAGLVVKREGDRLIISGPGPVPPALQEAIQTGQAERIFDGPARCYACGQFVGKPPTGRPRKYCSEKCRSQWRRQRRKANQGREGNRMKETTECGFDVSRILRVERQEAKWCSECGRRIPMPWIPAVAGEAPRRTGPRVCSACRNRRKGDQE